MTIGSFWNKKERRTLNRFTIHKVYKRRERVSPNTPLHMLPSNRTVWDKADYDMGKEGSSGWYTDEKRGSLLCAVDYGQKMKRVVYTVHKSVKRGKCWSKKRKKEILVFFGRKRSFPLLFRSERYSGRSVHYTTNYFRTRLLLYKEENLSDDDDDAHLVINAY